MPAINPMKMLSHEAVRNTQINIVLSLLDPSRYTEIPESKLSDDSIFVSRQIAINDQPGSLAKAKAIIDNLNIFIANRDLLIPPYFRINDGQIEVFSKLSFGLNLSQLAQELEEDRDRGKVSKSR